MNYKFIINKITRSGDELSIEISVFKETELAAWNKAKDVTRTIQLKTLQTIDDLIKTLKNEMKTEITDKDVIYFSIPSEIIMKI